MTPFQLDIQHLSKSYGQLSVIHDLNLTLDSGNIYCLMGPSGSGKTTLLRLLLGLESPDSGKICLTPQPERQLVAVFQENRLCESFSALDNLTLTAGRLYDRKMLYQELLCLLPEESILRPVSTLSGGMKRRVAIARALLTPSCGILMDEPFTGLDDETRLNVIQYVKEKTTGKLLIVSTHQEDDVAALGGRLLRFDSFHT